MANSLFIPGLDAVFSFFRKVRTQLALPLGFLLTFFFSCFSIDRFQPRPKSYAVGPRLHPPLPTPALTLISLPSEPRPILPPPLLPPTWPPYRSSHSSPEFSSPIRPCVVRFLDMCLSPRPLVCFSSRWTCWSYSSCFLKNILIAP